MSEDDLKEIKFKLSDKSKEVDLLTYEATREACGPIVDYSEKLLYGKAYHPCK